MRLISRALAACSRVIRRDGKGKAQRAIGTHDEVTGCKVAEARAAAHANAMLLIATGAALPDILAAVVRSVETARDWRCRIRLAEDAGSRLPARAAPWLPDAPELDGLSACCSEPIVGSGGTLLGALATYRRDAGQPSASDIDSLVEAAQIAAIAIERKRAEQALQDREERLQRALDASRLALWDFDLDSGEVYISDAWSEMLGGPRVPTSTTAAALMTLVPDEDRPRIATALADTLSGRSSTYSVEHRVRRPDGRTLWVLSQGRVVERDASGCVHRAVGTNRDITQRKRAELTQALLEAQLREAQKLEAIGTLAGGIAHDFNNIMAAILGNVAFARQDLGAEHPVQSHLKQISKAGQRARSLVQQILAFSRKQADEQVNQPLAPMVEETVAMIRSMAGRSARVELVLPHGPLDVKANMTQLQQVLLNLGTNAWQALPGGAGHVEIGLDQAVIEGGSARRPARLAAGTYAHLWVRDDGCGMDEATRTRIFEPFFTTKPIGQGTGLGLAVAHGIVEAHGGAIAVTTAPGQGSSFDIYLPLVDHESGLMPLEASPGEPQRGTGQHVLYVDDDEVMALMVQGLLERLGYRATCLLDAREAIAAVEREPAAIDLVVTDFNMPNVSGLDVVRAVARIRADLPVVISSGYVSDELRASAAELGVRSILQKEHTLEELGALVHESLAHPRPHAGRPAPAFGSRAG